MGRKGYFQKQAKADRKPVELPPDEPWVPPSKAECEEEVLTVYLDVHGKLRITQRLRRFESQLVDFAVTLSEKQDNGSWVEITCIDCCHGSVHRHDGPHGSTESKVIRPILQQIDVQQSWNESYDAVFESYIEYVGEDMV